MDPNSSIQIYRVADLGHVVMFRWNWRKEEQRVNEITKKKVNDRQVMQTGREIMRLIEVDDYDPTYEVVDAITYP